MIFDGQYKLAIRENEPPLLFDLAADPLEEINIAARYPGIVDRLQHLLKLEQTER
jgi:hypothetical protein